MSLPRLYEKMGVEYKMVEVPLPVELITLLEKCLIEERTQRVPPPAAIKLLGEEKIRKSQYEVDYQDQIAGIVLQFLWLNRGEYSKPLKKEIIEYKDRELSMFVKMMDEAKAEMERRAALKGAH